MHMAVENVRGLIYYDFLYARLFLRGHFEIITPVYMNTPPIIHGAGSYILWLNVTRLEDNLGAT